MQKESAHILDILKQTQVALKHKDAVGLKNLSNQTIHTSCADQDSGSITSAVIIYTLSKLIERQDYKRIKSWEKFVTRFNSTLNLAIQALTEHNQTQYEEYLKKARVVLESISINLKPYINEILKKACINKASKIYEHGISLGRTSQLLGVSQWEISEYSGQKDIHERSQTLSAKKRAKMALEFLS